ncbi:QDE-2-interacting protein [Drepanopeziza brunnea f. sp. 'multigermtubi' MB_m1]|uniref:QDE-2-interacting protein n=1 Tax=Marssonina brunnea f. sp. multigermtubi (strain MB_m1) TaxID=1072389 RepID=K1WRH3_MARBU|nr:QDE-2-interacting protein [Drepanopeziza brunnea f. sp. 'multigermtubi' MB_m1]EKD15012.1 QDE-2-interacting protein [Drepanopeziza brunnea f. sp. 'multigermtubi' MB_m1]
MKNTTWHRAEVFRLDTWLAVFQRNLTPNLEKDEIHQELWDSAPILLSIDFEKKKRRGCNRDRGTIREIGVSTFDIRSLPSRPLNCQKTSDTFLFNKSQSFNQDSTAHLLQSILREDGSRTLLIVGHALRYELALLRDIGIDASDPAEYPNIAGCLDTKNLAGKLVFNPIGWLRKAALSDVLERLYIPYANLHVAGNDANFTLKAMLLLSLHDIARRRAMGPSIDPSGNMASVREIAWGLSKVS